MKALSKLSLPIVLSNILMTLINFSSTIMLWYVNKESLGTWALIASVLSFTIAMTWGFFSNMSGMISESSGSLAHEKKHYYLCAGFVWALILGVCLSAVIWNLDNIFKLFYGNKELISLMPACLHALAYSLVPDLLLCVFFQWFIGCQQSRICFLLTLLWVGLSITLNAIFVFGIFHHEGLGLAGIGWGTSLSAWIMIFVTGIVFYCHPMTHAWKSPIILEEMLKIMRIIMRQGCSVSLMFGLEVGFFSIITLLAGLLSVRTNYGLFAEHQLAMQCVWLSSMISLGIAQAMTVQIAFQKGKQDLLPCREIAYVGIIEIVILMGLWGIFFWVSHFSKPLLTIALVFQLFESVRIILFGALRGLDKTGFTLLVSLGIYWFLALPIGSYLAFSKSMNIVGLWEGMLVGAIVGCLCLWAKLIVSTRKRGLLC